MTFAVNGPLTNKSNTASTVNYSLKISIDPPTVYIDGQSYTMTQHIGSKESGSYPDSSPGYEYSASYNGFSGPVGLPLLDGKNEIGTISRFRDKMAGMRGDDVHGWYLALDPRNENTRTGTLAFRPRMVGNYNSHLRDRSTQELEIGRFENEVTVTRGGTGTIKLENFDVSKLVTGTYSAILVITVEVGT